MTATVNGKNRLYPSKASRPANPAQ